MGHSPEGRGRGQTDIYKISPNNFFFPESSYIYVCQADSSLGLTKEFEKNWIRANALLINKNPNSEVKFL